MNFRSSGVQPALIKTSVVGNVSKETGIRREGEKKPASNHTEPHPKKEREQQNKEEEEEVAQWVSHSRLSSCGI